MKTPILAFITLLLIGAGVDFGTGSFIQLILIYVLINMIMAMSLNLVNGFTGQFSLGHAGFMAVGAYTSAFISTLVAAPAGFAQFFYYILLAFCGGLASALAGFAVGLPSLRLRGDYLAIVTLGFGEIIRVILLNTPAVGGARGMYGIVGPAGWDADSYSVSRFLLGYSHAIFWVLVCFMVIWRIMRSTYGREFMSVREDEIAGEAMGVNTTRVKVQAFVLSSFFAGVAGSIFAHYTNYLNPASFAFTRSVDSIIMVVLGGMGSLSGSLLAAIFITVLPELLRPLVETTGVDLRMVIYSLSLILLMILRPKGIMGSKEIRFWAQKQGGKNDVHAS
jgi:branched-chain amino acid transport system permease protein